MGRARVCPSYSKLTGSAEPRGTPHWGHIYLWLLFSPSKRGIQALPCLAPCGPQRDVEPPAESFSGQTDRALPLLSGLLWPLGKTLSSCHGPCQVARSPWESCQGKEGSWGRRGDRRGGGTSPRWLPRGLWRKVGGSISGRGGVLELVAAKLLLSGSEPETQAREGTCPRSYRGRSEELAGSLVSWGWGRRSLLSGHF